MPEVAGAAGNYIEADDPDGLREAMIRLIDDQAHWQACREAGLQQARLFTWERCASITASAYRQALGG
jgi:alpha-1,3-rhamnosyl/mannosyltransferase